MQLDRSMTYFGGAEREWGDAFLVPHPSSLIFIRLLLRHE